MGDQQTIIITGPTASGKSALAVELGERLGTEIISADSRQIYSGIPIVTAMPSDEERSRVRHHLIDCLPLDAYYSAAEFESDALRISRRLRSEGRTPLICGGSMMYVDAFCNGIDLLPTVPDDIRNGLKQEWNDRGDEWMLRELQRIDPAYYDRVDRCNLKRVFHAVEISRTAGSPYSSLLTGQRKKREFPILKVWLEAPRELLFRRINERVDAMVEAGLEKEARSVFAMRGLNSLNTVGLKEMFAYFDGVMERDEAISRIKKNTRVFAKKQLTWRKRPASMAAATADDNIREIPLDISLGTEAMADAILREMRR